MNLQHRTGQWLPMLHPQLQLMLKGTTASLAAGRTQGCGTPDFYRILPACMHAPTHLHGAAKSVLLFLPAMPPNIVSGMVTRPQMIRMITMVPNGKAAVDCSRAQHHQHTIAGTADNLVRQSYTTHEGVLFCCNMQETGACEAGKNCSKSEEMAACKLLGAACVIPLLLH